MRRIWLTLGALALAAVGLLAPTTAASAHVVPSTTVELDVHPDRVEAALTLPTADLRTASALPLADGADPDAATARRVAAYLGRHVAADSSSGPWRIAVGEIAAARTQQWGTRPFAAITARATLTPPTAAEVRTFTLRYDAIVHQVVTADVYVVLHDDWSTGELDSARPLGLIRTDTTTGAVAPLPVRLAEGSSGQGFLGMLTLGMSHIREGTDHQLFLLTLLLAAPLLAAGRRWTGVRTGWGSARAIAGVTLAFTLGHSLTLLLGALGLPVPQSPVEALIAVSILVAALHAARPLFPGREALVAGTFGLVHGLAFSTTLSALDLNGGQLVLSLLGFNLGIEILQLVVVLLVLPPLVILARTPAGRPLRLGAAALTSIAALGWLLDRLGMPNVVGAFADGLGALSPWVVGSLWVAAAAVAVVARRHARGTASDGSPGARLAPTPSS